MKPIKAFTPYNLNTPALHAWCVKAAKSKPARLAEVLQFFISRDPAAHEWGHTGFVAPIEEGQLVHDLDGSAYLMCVRFNQRILPAAVRDEKLGARIAALQAKEDRELTRQEYAQCRDEMEAELLPVAFVKRTDVPVFIYKDRLIIGTPSAKTCESIIGHLQRMMVARDIDCEVWNIWTEKHLGDTLKHAAFNDDEEFFEVADAAVFKGADKRKLSIKDRSISSTEVQQALAQGSYAVLELRMNWMTEDEETLATVTLTDKLIVKQIKLSEALFTESLEDIHATLFIVSRQFYALLGDVISMFGGESDEPPEAATPKEDEL